MQQPALGGIDPNALMSRLGEEAKREDDGANGNAVDDEADEEAKAEASK